MRAKIFTILILSAVCQYGWAQQKIGASPTSIQPGQLLQLEKNGTKAGLKIAEVALTGADDVTTINIPTTAVGTMIWNTATAGSGGTAVFPGFYIWNGSQWDRLISASSPNNFYTTSGVLTGNRTVFQNSNTLSFVASALNAFSVDGSTFSVDALNNRVGIGLAAPREQLEVLGNIRFSRALMPDGLAGTAGQVLTSAGAGLAPTWTDPTALPTTVGNTLTGASLSTTVNGVTGTAVDLTPALAAATTVSNASMTNTSTVMVNGVASTGAPIINTNALGLTGSSITSTVNGVASNTIDLTPALAAATTVGNTLTGSSLTTTVNGVTGTAVDLTPALAAATTVSNASTANTSTVTVNGVASTGAPIINTNVLGLSGSNITATVNGIASNTLDITPALAAATTVSNASTANTSTVTVNGVASTGAPIINTNVLGLSGSNLTATVNGVASNTLDLTPALAAATTVGNTLTGASLTTTVNGVTGTAVDLTPALAAATTVGNTLTGASLTTTVNGVTGTGVDLTPALAAATTVSNASTANTSTVTVNGVASTGAPIINTNALGLTGSLITSTVNGVASNTLNLAPALAAATTVSNASTANTSTVTVNGVASTGAPIINSNTLTANNNLVTTVNGVAATLTPAVGTIANSLGFSSTGALVTQAPTAANTPNIYTADGTLTGSRTVTQGTNNLTFGSTATTTTAQNLNANAITTGTAKAITANALTTGTGLSVSSSSAGLSSTNGLLQVANTGASTTGILARFQANATAGSGMTITNSGNVGIGTTTPNNSITIVNDGGAGAKDDILVQGYNSQPTLYMNNTGGTLASPTNTATGSQMGSWYLGGRVNGITSYLTTIIGSYRGDGTTSLSDLQFSTSGSARMTINENGNVGIGTTSPVGALNIVNNATGIDAKDNLVIQTYKGGSTNAPGVIILSDNGTESLPTNLNNGEILGSVLFGGRIGGASVRVSEVTGTYKGNGTTTLSDLQFKTSGTIRMTIDENGNVGIGTTTPNSPLQFANTLENRKIVLWENSNNDHQFYGLGINSSIQRYQVAATSADHVFFAATSATTSNELMRIRGNGNVGIGTATPAFPLQMGSGARVTAAGVWTDVSDRRLKTNIKDGVYGMKEVMQLRPVSYNMKSDQSAQIGFIAQEVQKIIPEVVNGVEGDISKGETLGLSYGNMVAVLVKALQEQQVLIENIKKDQKIQMDKMQQQIDELLKQKK